MTVVPAVQAKLTWQDHLTFHADIRGHRVVTDALAPHGDDRGPSPVELLLVALAGCTAMDVVSILTKQRLAVRRFAVHCEGDRATDHPRRLTAVRLVFELEGEGLLQEAVERAVQLSLERYCSVFGTLLHPPAVATQVVIGPPTPSADR